MSHWACQAGSGIAGRSPSQRVMVLDPAHGSDGPLLQRGSQPTLAKILVCSRLSLSRKSLHGSTTLLHLVQARSRCAPCCSEGCRTAACGASQQASGPGALWRGLVWQAVAQRCLQWAQACCGGPHVAACHSPAVSVLHHTAHKWPKLCCGGPQTTACRCSPGICPCRGQSCCGDCERAACRVAGRHEPESALIWAPALL